jgi:hypothetical protein
MGEEIQLNITLFTTFKFNRLQSLVLATYASPTPITPDVILRLVETERPIPRLYRLYGACREMFTSEKPIDLLDSLYSVLKSLLKQS